ncbi:MAG: EGF domain-containing protein, partial [Myxococcota bacterium]
CANADDNDCSEDATCANTEGSYTCTCNPGFVGNGQTCTDVDECAEEMDACDQECTNTEGSYTCGCSEGWVLGENGRSCLDVDECANADDNDCSEDATCANTEGSYTCTCNPGFVGNGRVCSDAVDCSGENPCSPGVCVDTPGSWRCDCPCGWFNDTQFSCADAYPNILFVDIDVVSGAHTGECWGNAFRDLQDALAVAQPGDSIWIADGDYLPGEEPTDTFAVPAGVSLYGGFEGVETSLDERDTGRHRTVLSGDVNDDDGSEMWFPFSIYDDDVRHVVTIAEGGPGVLLDGLSIHGGASDERAGSAILHQAGALTVSDCRFWKNASLDNGLAAAIFSTSELTIRNSRMERTEGMIRSEGGMLTLEGTQMEISAGFSPGVMALGSDVFVRDANVTSVTFQLQDAPVHIEDSTFTNAQTTLLNTTTEIDNLTFEDTFPDGGLRVRGGFIAITRSMFDGNNLSDSAYDGGGAVAIHDAIVRIRDNTFTNNSVTVFSAKAGGALYGENISGDIVHNRFLNNVAGRDTGFVTSSTLGNGGAIGLINSHVLIRENHFEDNISRRYGGAIFLDRGGIVTLRDNVFQSNTAEWSGGAISLASTEADIDRCTFLGNSAGTGGALLAQSGLLTIRRSLFSQQRADQGGAIAALSHPHSYPAQIRQTLFLDNSATRGGALLSFGRPFDLTQCALLANTAVTHNSLSIEALGGAIYTSGPLTVAWSTLAHNLADVDADAIYLDDPWPASLAVRDSVIWSTDATHTPIVGAPEMPISVQTSCIQAGYDGPTNTALTETPFTSGGATPTARMALREGSPCLDTASDQLPPDLDDLDDDNNTTEALPLDLALQPRQAGLADPGAFERCPEGCPGGCGDGVCRDGETCTTCPGDCGECPSECGDEVCGLGESCVTCPDDCEPCDVSCGDGFCNGVETCTTCPGDCGMCRPVCGDGVCLGETCIDCTDDCGICPVVCGDGHCEADETCSTCAADCGACPPPCGNDVCDDHESCSVCPEDCGMCPDACPADGCVDQLCTRDGWCWVRPLPHGHTLRAIWGLDGEPQWAVGDTGTLMRWDGARWLTLNTGINQAIYDVWGTSPTNVWAVGEDGLVLHYNGLEWATETAPTSSTLRTVWGTGADDVWAMGEQVILRYDGNTWTAEETFWNVLALDGVDGLLWAVGSGWDGLLLEGDGDGDWEQVYANQIPGGQQTWNDVWVHSPTEAWVAGRYITSNYDGTSWQPIPDAPNAIFYGVHGTRSNDVWFVGENVLAHFDGASWVEETLPASLYTVWAAGDEDVWTAGNGGLMMHYTGDAWSIESGEAVDEFSLYTDVWAQDDTLVAVRQYGADAWNGQTWSSLDVEPPSTVRAAWGLDPSNVWLVGSAPLQPNSFEPQQAAVWRFDGQTWSEPTYLPFLPFNDLWGTADDNIWAVGESGIHHYDGTVWSQWPTPVVHDLNAIHGSSPDNIWAGGDDHVLWHFDGQEWELVAANAVCCSFGFDGFAVLDHTHVWATAFDELWTYDGFGWEMVPSPSPYVLSGVWGYDRSHVWLADVNGSVFRFDGTQWHPSTTNASSYLSAIWGQAPNRVWVAGQGHAILEHRP